MVALIVVLGLLVVAGALYLAAILVVPRQYVGWMNRLDRSRGAIRQEEEACRERLVQDIARLAGFERLAESDDFRPQYQAARDALVQASNTLDRVESWSHRYHGARITPDGWKSAAPLKKVNEAIRQLVGNHAMIVALQGLESRLVRMLDKAESKIQTLHDKPAALQHECRQLLEKIPALETVIAGERKAGLDTTEWENCVAAINEQLKAVLPFLHVDADKLEAHVAQFHQSQVAFETFSGEVHRCAQQRKELDLRLDTLDKTIVWPALSPLVQQIGRESRNASLAARQKRHIPEAQQFLDLLSELLKADALMLELESIAPLSSKANVVQPALEEFCDILNTLPGNVNDLVLAQTISKLQACHTRARSAIDTHKAEVTKAAKSAAAARDRLRSAFEALRGIAALSKEPLVLRHNQFLPSYDAAEGNPKALQGWTTKADSLRREIEEASADLRRKESQARATVSGMQWWRKHSEERAQEWFCFGRQAAIISSKAADAEARLNSIRALDTIAELEAAVRDILRLRAGTRTEYNRLENLHQLLQGLVGHVTDGWVRLTQTSFVQDISMRGFLDKQLDFAHQSDDFNAAWLSLTSCWTTIQGSLQKQSLPVMISLTQYIEPFSPRIQLDRELNLILPIETDAWTDDPFQLGREEPWKDLLR